MVSARPSRAISTSRCLSRGAPSSNHCAATDRKLLSTWSSTIWCARRDTRTRGLDCTLIFEPGRLIVGNAGILVTRVIYVKHGEARNFVIVDAAMNDLIRPTLYEAYHDLLPVRLAEPGAASIVTDVVGPVCESGDYLALDRTMPEPSSGDLLAVMTAGAYGAVQSGTYNTRPLVPEVLVKDDKYAVVRPRIDVDALIAMDRTAPWL
jgi:diaminopimelate decarboxylase